MSDTHKLLLALIDKIGYDVKETTVKTSKIFEGGNDPHNGLISCQYESTTTDYTLTKRKSK